MRRVWILALLLLAFAVGAACVSLFRWRDPMPAVGETLPDNLGSEVEPGEFDWPQYRGPNRDGTSEEADWKASWDGKPSTLWEARLGTGASSVAIAEGRLFTSGNSDAHDTVYCLNAETGERIWRFRYPSPLETRQFEGGPAATPTVDEGRVYVLSHDGQLFCLDARTGAQYWGLHVVTDLGGDRPRWGFAGSPLVARERLILDIGGEGSSTVALDKATGDVLWARGDDPAGYASPVLFDAPAGQAVAVFKGEALVARGLGDGDILWRYPWDTRYDVNAATPVFEEGKVFICSGYGRGGAVLDFSSGKPQPVWENTSLRTHFSSSLLHEDHLYGVDDRGELRCVSFATGLVRWKERGFGKGSVILGGDTLIVLAERGELVTVETDPEAYREISRAKVLAGRCWISPALASGRIYVKDNDGHLLCLDVRG